MINAAPVFDTRADAENYVETLQMRGYMRSEGWEADIEREEDGWSVHLYRIWKERD